MFQVVSTFTYLLILSLLTSQCRKAQLAVKGTEPCEVPPRTNSAHNQFVNLIEKATTVLTRKKLKMESNRMPNSVHKASEGRDILFRDSVSRVLDTSKRSSFVLDIS